MGDAVALVGGGGAESLSGDRRSVVEVSLAGAVGERCFGRPLFLCLPLVAAGCSDVRLDERVIECEWCRARHRSDLTRTASHPTHAFAVPRLSDQKEFEHSS